LGNRELYIRAKTYQKFLEKEKLFVYKHLSLAEFEGGPAHNKRFHVRRSLPVAPQVSPAFARTVLLNRIQENYFTGH